MKPLIGSRISFYRNGQYLGVAFEDIYEGFYFPSISLYKNCKVTVNFGPNFRYPPANFGEGDIKIGSKLDWFPVQALAQVEIIDNLLSDMLYILGEEMSEEGNKLERMIKESLMN